MPERLVEAVLRAEVGDGPGQLVGVVADEPAVGAVLHVALEVAQDVADLGHEARVVEQAGPVDGTGAGPGSGCGGGSTTWRSIRLQITRARGCHAQYRL